MLRFHKTLHFRRKKLKTGVLALGSMGFLIFVHGILLGACKFTLIMEKGSGGYCLEKAQVAGIVGIVGIVGMIGIVGMTN